MNLLAGILRVIYASGQQVSIGDEVELGKSRGVVAALIREVIYLSPFRAEDWDFLEHGMLVNFSDIGLIYYIEPEPDLVLLKRAINI